MSLSRHQNAVRNRDLKIAKRSFENVSHFKYLGTTVTNQNLIQEEIKMRLTLSYPAPGSRDRCFVELVELVSLGRA
jgi:hypothetical protein